MKSSRTLWFVVRQLIIVVGAVVAYFGVRGLTEGDVVTAEGNAVRVLELERAFGLAVETSIQTGVLASGLLVTLANWVYIWLHWPVLVGTLIWLIRVDRGEYFELRNAMIVSGLIGLVIFAVFPVAPPRLSGLEYIDTVTERSHSYRVLQPPGFVNAYAAVPSLHFGWNLLVGLTWMRVGHTRPWKIGGVLMPLAMAWAVVATANHWVFDVFAGGAVALIGVAIERERRVRIERRDEPGQATSPMQPSPRPSCDAPAAPDDLGLGAVDLDARAGTSRRLRHGISTASGVSDLCRGDLDR